jgi:hypothetical protein
MSAVADTYTPRIKDQYEREIRPRLKDELELDSISSRCARGCPSARASRCAAR